MASDSCASTHFEVMHCSRAGTFFSSLKKEDPAEAAADSSAFSMTFHLRSTCVSDRVSSR